ncbi:oxepin-CoA hydrolase/3-oxo-5,6-dehydrosuberyl-CoA semialdehyde dehydrogenase [Kineococcus xinjiangensis]|uniref:Oxepin-CoA hydrolase/3-oxo-5,6-dehydrosuberyl-CoA semialdehyde dehydrogenase n=1 Tax=Kineococcus xinjiangensis TaxID=512762 RepID=A0A2S6IK37_9ACTN|nr:phenylacetic acid degradation bifunctional protein PaaZ [Kineococcus xinjiangensis]PPK94594.1 oxepin-CoA hydrolase/3-oxo-5,6-dehydrosuberyl-CoA semialdehyde dehydrogenase [Kineococcus xinjiangensis]
MTATAVRDVATVDSFIAGRWSAPGGETATLLHAATSEPVARIAATTPDAATAAEHARRVGGPALRALTFHQRALLLKQLAQHLDARKDHFYDLSTWTGATRRDSLIDIDGGIGVLFTYGSKGRRELPGGTVYLDGPTEPLGRGGQFLGQHVYTPRHGVAVQINAFNFPVWGMLEKLAPAFLAGVPTIVKPASQTAYLAEAVVREALESGLLPEGSLQLLAGSARGVLDVLGDQDLVAFTGSASTANSLRSHRAVLEGGVRFTSEADSLNFSLLGPDAVPGTAEFDLFVRQLVTEMTAKAGQKCTAIRRALVPVELLGAVSEAVEARIAEKVRVGHPGADGVTMGALVSLQQREEVRARVGDLQRAARIVVGDPTRMELVDADAERGAFLPPMLLLAEDAGRPEVHEVEAFGPVSTLLGYRSTAEAVELAARGKGSLVGSVVSADTDVVRDVVLGVAPWHGRVLVLDRDSAKESTGHGSPLPHLTHGGPGRAGDGEELGGIRGVLHYMQRTALQGSPRALSAVTGTWFPGAPRSTPQEHPFRLSLAELSVGDCVEAGPRTVTLEDIEHFADFSGDRFYAHMDQEAAAANPFFEGRVAHGYFLVSMAAGLFVQPDPGPVLANYGLEDLRFLTPVYPGDQVRVQLTAKSIAPRVDADYGEVRWDARLLNQRDELVATYDVLTLVAKTR